MWFEKVSANLSQQGLSSRVQYILMEDGMGSDPDCQYVQAIKEVSDRSLDFCLVDGLHRDSCADRALPKLKRGGLLIIDNANWYIPRSPRSCSPNSRSFEDGFPTQQWKVVFDALATWRCIWTSNGVTDTAIWVCPAK